MLEWLLPSVPLQEQPRVLVFPVRKRVLQEKRRLPQLPFEHGFLRGYRQWKVFSLPCCFRPGTSNT